MGSANVDIDSAFQGIENAVVKENSPKLPPNCTGRGKVVRFDVFPSEKSSGLCAAFEFEILESNRDDVRQGVIFGKVITNLDSNDKGKKAKKQGLLLQAIAAVMNEDHKDPNLLKNLTKLIRYGRDKGAFNGKAFRFVTGPEATTDSGHKYTPMTFMPDVPQTEE